MDIDSRILDDNNARYKITVDYLAIKVNNLHEDRYYYTIIYHPVNSENTYEGNGSYSLSIVNEWLEEYFILK